MCNLKGVLIKKELIWYQSKKILVTNEEDSDCESLCLVLELDDSDDDSIQDFYDFPENINELIFQIISKVKLT